MWEGLVELDPFGFIACGRLAFRSSAILPWILVNGYGDRSEVGDVDECNTGDVGERTCGGVQCAVRRKMKHHVKMWRAAGVSVCSFAVVSGQVVLPARQFQNRSVSAVRM